MAKNESNMKIQRFVSTTGKNQYLLISAGEAAAIDVSEAHAGFNALGRLEKGVRHIVG